MKNSSKIQQLKVFVIVLMTLLSLMSMKNPKKIIEHLPNRKTQVKIVNKSNFYRTIHLWGGYDLTNFCSINTDTLDELEIQETINTPFTGLRKLVHNPYNDLVYVLQNSNEVVLYTSDGILVGTIPLAVGASPTDIVIQKNIASTNYGRVYISSRTVNTVTVLETNLTILTTIGVGVSPGAIALNEATELLYVANGSSSSVSVISILNNTSIGVFLSPSPAYIAVNSSNGDVYVTTKLNRVSIYKANLNFQVAIVLNDQKIREITYNPINQRMYVCTAGTSRLHSIDAQTYSLISSRVIRGGLEAMVFNPNNSLLIIATLNDRYIGLDSNETIVSTINIHPFGLGLAINLSDNVLWATNPITGQIFKVGYPECNDVVIDDDYLEKAESTKYNPIYVGHIRFSFTDNDMFKTMALITKHSTGSVQQRIVSTGNYISPQHWQSIIDIYDLEGLIIDGENSWEFKIAPLQSITILVHYRQLIRGRRFD